MCLGKKETDESHLASLHCTKLYARKAQESEPISTNSYLELVAYDLHIYLQDFKFQTFYKMLTLSFMWHPQQKMVDI